MSKNNLKKLLSLLMVISMLFVSVPTVVVAETASSDEEYIEICTIEDLYNVRLDLTANYILMNDIDLTEATAPGGEWDFMGKGWNPIGSNDIYDDLAFSGIFDGNGYSIIGMIINAGTLPSGASSSYSYAGLFANVTGEVRNLDMKAVNISNGCMYTGAIAAVNSGTITNCSVSGVVKSDDKAGGLVADNNGTISKSYNTASVTGETHVGGIAGENSKVISDCYNTAEINNPRCESGHYAAGITAFNYGASSSDKAQVLRCYNIGKVKATFSPTYSCAIAYNYNNYSVVTDSYYLSKTGVGNVGATSLTDAQMRLESMYTDFDFENTWVLNKYANHPYPQLKSNIQDLSESASLVSIVALPSKTEYFTGDKLDFTGGMVKVVYASGREEVTDITDDIISAVDMNTVGEQTVTVSVGGKSDTFTIIVKERPQVEKVTILFQPDKKEFIVGSEFDFTGAKAQITYKGGIIEYIDITPDMTTGGDINHIGKQTITYSMNGVSASFEIEVVGITLESIALTKLPDKVTYLEGDSFSAQGLEVTATMNDGSQAVIGDGYTISGYSPEPGTHTITVTYLGKTATFEVTVSSKSIVSISLNSLPDKLEYISGQEFDDTGMQVIANYDNGDTEVIEEYTISGFDNVPGIKNVTVSVSGYSVTFPVKIISRVITDLYIKTQPSKLEYIEYEELDLTGLIVEAEYNDGSTETVEDYALTGFSSEIGVHTVMVTYNGFYDSFDIVVMARTLEDIKITPPSKTLYMLGEDFDPSGLVVIACYDNGQEIEVGGYQLSGFDSLSAGTKAVTVTYGGISRSFAVVINDRTAVATGGKIIVSKVIGRLGETVDVSVAVTDNAGIAGFTHTLEFDAAALSFVEAELAENYADGILVVNDEKISEGILTVLWIGVKDVLGDGDLYSLKFEVLETAVDGESEIRMKFDDNDNANLSGDNMIFGKENGSVEVRSWWLGDLNGDRVFAMVDLLQLAQYVSGKEMTMTEKQLLSADVNEDGIIDIHDVILLNQWILEADI